MVKIWLSFWRTKELQDQGTSTPSAALPENYRHKGKQNIHTSKTCYKVSGSTSPSQMLESQAWYLAITNSFLYI